jgi:uncharacterized protein (TIGR02118 family)
VLNDEDQMRKIVVLYGHPTDADRFRRYYEETHLPLAAKLPGLKASRHSFDLVGTGGSSSPYFCMWEGESQHMRKRAI